jgi:hypothetical protein
LEQSCKKSKSNPFKETPIHHSNIGSTLSHGIKYTNIQGTSVTSSIIGRQGVGAGKGLYAPSIDIKERLVNGIKNSNYP